MKLGYVPFGTGHVAPFDQVFNEEARLDPRKPETFDGCDAIVVWGGADISPAIYGEPASKLTYADAKLSSRDEYEVACCKIAIERGIPIIGVCRGAQLACAMAGGKLVQHVDNHGRSHSITTKDGRQMITSSVHHQMMYPWDVPHDLIAWSIHNLSHRYIMGDDRHCDALSDKPEPEIVYFPKIKALAIQGHPEFMDEDCEFVQYCNQLVSTYLLKEKADVVAG